MAILISDDYRAQQRMLHEREDYGTASIAFAPIVAKLALDNGFTEILDYGAGKGQLARKLAEIMPSCPTVYAYDPAVPEFSAPPAPCDFVVCIDVLEHIEPDCLEAVLDDLRRVTRKLGFFTVHTAPAAKVLPDGRNAHLIQEMPRFWLEKIMARFDLMLFQRTDTGFMVVVATQEGAADRWHKLRQG